MSRRLKPLPLLEGDQRDASDPVAHAALSASAGTGKTQVLIARVLRLLLGGVPPAAILCLTFTKSGAAEMANRLGDRLASWVRLPEQALAKELFSLGELNDKAALQKARRLFARVIEAPGGLRIQTIHAFAQTLLASFPAEAEITPGFQPIEGRAEAELARRTLATLLSKAEAGGAQALIDDVGALSRRLGEQDAEKYLMDCARAHDAIAALGDPAGVEARLHLFMNLGDGTATADTVLAHWLADEQLDRSLFNRLIDANRAWRGSKTAATIVTNLTAFLDAPTADRATLLDGLGKNIVTAKGELCKVYDAQAAADPGYPDLAADFAEWLAAMRGIRIGFDLAALQAAGLRAGAAFASAYVEAKRAAGVADFDDLIRWTRKLFDVPGMGEWIRFKLDQRTDHVLVDEAQDTNADQWRIVDALVGEFFSGSAESEDRWRTLFMVGDFKQAIYGFQGTDPREFEGYRRSVTVRADALAEAAADAEISPREFRDLSISASFRSSPAVLDVVDAVIGDLGHAAMGLPAAPEAHVAARPDRPGSVELWPPFIAGRIDGEAGSDDGEEGWIDKPLRLYADRLARQVRGWLDEAPTLATTGRPMTAGDVLILVRSRTELASLVVARLFEHGVPVAGIDRLHLAKPLAVKDLLSAIRFAVQPEDDLNLASLLVSPLLGWNQQQLFDLAYGREPGMTLWRLLQRDQASATLATLRDLLNMADNVTPARFLGELLSGRHQGRRKLLARLGEAARDPIEELVSIALDFERQETASLNRFLAWFASGEVEVKRDAAAPSNAVRVMTVHGAKGLEAPVVLLADATHDPARIGQARSVMAVKLGGDYPVPLIRPRASERVFPFAALMDLQKARDLEEHWRLLYVGLTRAAERLVIAGVQPKYALSDTSWHSTARRALEALGAPPLDQAEGGEGLHWRLEGRAGGRRAVRRTLPAPPLPAWATTMAPEEERPPRPLAPSSLGEDRDAVPPPSPAQRDAARRGTLLHTLFERLPAVAPDERRAVAERWLERQGIADSASRADIVAAALTVIENPAFADLFGPDALAEAPIAATLADGTVIAGTVDRLCIGAEVVRVVDFKTGRVIPPSLAEVPPSHQRQMAAYADALRVIFPGRRIEAALLYTHAPRWIVVDG